MFFPELMRLLLHGNQQEFLALGDGFPVTALLGEFVHFLAERLDLPLGAEAFGAGALLLGEVVGMGKGEAEQALGLFVVAGLVHHGGEADEEVRLVGEELVAGGEKLGVGYGDVGQGGGEAGVVEVGAAELGLERDGLGQVVDNLAGAGAERAAVVVAAPEILRDDDVHHGVAGTLIEGLACGGEGGVAVGQFELEEGQQLARGRAGGVEDERSVDVGAGEGMKL